MIPDLIAPILVAKAADLKVLRYMNRNGGYNIEVTAFCPALFQDIGRDLIKFCLQLRPVFIVVQVSIFLIAVNVIAAKGSCLRQLLF